MDQRSFIYIFNRIARSLSNLITPIVSSIATDRSRFDHHDLIIIPPKHAFLFGNLFIVGIPYY